MATRIALELAKAGKVQGNTYEKYLHKPAREPNKAIRSFQRSIKEHRDKIANPQNYDSEWHTFPEKRQRDKLEDWTKESKDFTEQHDIYEGILKNRDR